MQKLGEKEELQILDYWYINEFLSQEDWPDEDGSKRDIENKPKYLGESCLEIKKDEDIYSSISNRVKEHNMRLWGDITVYIGKIAREDCVKEIAQLLESVDDRPEKSSKSIAWASLQIDSKGEYVENSFSLSPILWAIKGLKNRKGHISDILNPESYKDSIEEFEETLRNTKKTSLSENNPQNIKNNSEINSSDRNVSNETQENQGFSSFAISAKQLFDILEKLKKEYLVGLLPGAKTDEKNNYEEVVLLVFNEYKDENAQEKYDDLEYTGLSHNFFLSDIKLVQGAIRDGKLGYEGMGGAIHKYITEPYFDFNSNPTISRTNIVKVKSNERKQYADFLATALDIENSPKAKWPSRYHPALMQQIAINASTTENNDAFPDVNYPVFSVNGPPGTGKTTMLKEVIASNIVERAKKLAEYEDPDQAFETKKFVNGKDGNKFYNWRYPNYYALKDKSINAYGMLVTSYNNSAVENITKELPMKDKLLEALKPSEKDDPEIKKCLNELHDLFDIEKSSDMETAYDCGVKVEVKDIYFSYWATELLNSNSQGEESHQAWGLVAAPLGKKSNINKFVSNVLTPICWLAYKEPLREAYKGKYIEARKNFLAQWEKVKKEKERIVEVKNSYSKFCSLNNEMRALEQELKDKEDALYNANEFLAEKQSQEKDHIERLDNETLLLKKEIGQLQSEINEFELKINQIDTQITNNEREQIEAQKTVKGIFGRKRKQDLADQLINQLSVECNKMKEEKEKLLNLQNPLKDSYDEKAECLKKNEIEINKIKRELADAQLSVQKKSEQCDTQKKEFHELEEKYANSSEKWSVLSEKISQQGGIVLNDEFVNDLLSEDEKKATNAQVSDPWFTFKYDVEREKLFYYALKMTKFFVLGSKSCICNLNHLCAYWSGNYKKEQEKITFTNEDKKQLVPALYQSLFLLVPVVSSTFASVGRFLKDIENQASIGMLVVDEAGQAQPQTALGGLFRSNRAIIVGDPRQVEPVVTDDLKMLKTAFKDELFSAYKVKSISVQKCADLLNPYGNYLENGTEHPEWVGSPLLVHRRCISPMYDISNVISYDGTMKQQTQEPKESKIKTFAGSSCWIDIAGKENGHKDHYNPSQGKKAIEIVRNAFEKAIEAGCNMPSLYIITPFNSVRNGISKDLRSYWFDWTKTGSKFLPAKKDYDSWIKDNIGTVHKFQGKEADQVIFLLGCDKSKEAEGAIRWVNTNIVNVAVTRAKYRLYVIGDGKAWKNNDPVRKAKAIIDTYKLKEIAADNFEYPANEDEAKHINSQLPSLQSFPIEFVENEDGSQETLVETDAFISELKSEKVAERSLTDEQVQKFGFSSVSEMDKFSERVRQNLEWGIKLYYLLEPIYRCNKDHSLDASCCAILFCKALELHVRDCLENGLKARMPEVKIKGKGRRQISLAQAKTDDITLGTFTFIIKNHLEELGGFFTQKGDRIHDTNWWNTYERKLYVATKARNNCCHSGLFTYKEVSRLLADMFNKDYSDPSTEEKSDGLIFSSLVGRKLTED